MKRDRAVEVLTRTINTYAIETEGNVMPARAANNSELCEILGISKKELRGLGIDIDSARYSL